jgi:gluconate 5-dehydrogenase
LNRNFLGVEPRISWIRSRTPAGDMGSPDDIAGTAIYLASDASNYVTGQVIAVDGGFLAGSDWG